MSEEERGSTLKLYEKVIESVMSATDSKFTGSSQPYKEAFRREWTEFMKEEFNRYANETEENEENEEETSKPITVKEEKEEKEDITVQPAFKKIKINSEDDDSLSDDESDLDDLIKNEADEKDPDNVIIGVTAGCKTNRGKWKGEILNCVLIRKGQPESLYKKFSCVFEQGGKK